MDALCPLVESSTDTAHDRLTLGAILRSFLPASLHLLKLGKTQSAGAFGALPPVVHRHWAAIFSLVPTVHIDTGRRAPAVTGIVRAVWPPKAGNG
jgi:hypothetical protein